MSVHCKPHKVYVILTSTKLEMLFDLSPTIIEPHPKIPKILFAKVLHLKSKVNKKDLSLKTRSHRLGKIISFEHKIF